MRSSAAVVFNSPGPHDDAHTFFATHAGIAVGHICGRLLVPGVENIERVSIVPAPKNPSSCMPGGQQCIDAPVV
jgi:hypothetical protein